MLYYNRVFIFARNDALFFALMKSISHDRILNIICFRKSPKMAVLSRDKSARLKNFAILGAS